MDTKKTDILVFAHWLGMKEPISMGLVPRSSASQKRLILICE